MALYYASQFFTTTLSVVGGVNDSITTDIVLQSVSGVSDTTKPGIALLSYADPLLTASAEWVTFTSINGTTKTLAGVTRGAEGFAAKAHVNGVTVAFPVSKSMINGVVDAIDGNYTFAGTKTFSSDINLATGKQLQVNSADPKRVIEIPAGGWSPTTTSGCAVITTTEAGTNDIDYKTLDFDTSSDEFAFTAFRMPLSWDAGTVEFSYIWTNAGGGAAETVTFSLSGRAYANDEAIDQATGTAVALADTWIAQGDIHQSAWSTAVTLAGTPTAGEWCHFKIMRDISEDDMTGDAQLIAVQLRYTESLATET